ncbi:MAG TPA: hypothetical protein VFH52_07460 [Rhodanobacteraceae bacterium]|nr:hypothetical protein [Rhodanobacteraceae bacterium]
MFRYERKHEPLLPWRDFLLRRVARSLALGLAVIAISLLAGMLGYRIAEHMGWLDAFLNAAMILGGMGPVDALHTSGGKVFAGVYALYSGLVVIFVAGLLFAPFAHRMLHRFHLETGREADGS